MEVTEGKPANSILMGVVFIPFDTTVDGIVTFLI